VIETPPPGGKGAKGRGNAMQTMMPVVGVLGSVGMMSTMRTGTSAVIGVGVLFVTVLGAFGMAFSQRGRSGKESREQRNRYLDYLERLREDFGKMERSNRKKALALNPPADALVDCVRDPARLWERRRSDPDFLLVRCATGRMPVVPATLASSGSMMDPPDPFMMAEAEALARRFALMPDMPLTIPLDLAGNVSIVGDRDGVVRIARALLLDAPVVLLDEPTTGLDVAAEELVVRALTRLADGRTVVMTTHRPALTRLATRTVHLSRGSIAAGPVAPAGPEAVGAPGAPGTSRAPLSHQPLPAHAPPPMHRPHAAPRAFPEPRPGRMHRIGAFDESVTPPRPPGPGRHRVDRPHQAPRR